MRRLPQLPGHGLVALAVSILLLALPAAAQTPHGLKTHMRLVNSMCDQTSPGEWRGGDGWVAAGPLATRGVNYVTNPYGYFSTCDFTATAEFGRLRFQGSGSAQSGPWCGLFLWVDDWIGAEPRAQYRDRLHVTSATLPAGTPVVLQFQLALSGSTTIVDSNPSAWVAASFLATRYAPYAELNLSLSATPGSTSGLFNAAVGDSIDVNGRLGVTLLANGMLALGPQSASIAADVTAQFDVVPQTPGVTIRYSSVRVSAVPPPAALPATLAFEGARPNPFNPVTTLPLAVAAPTRVELSVFDLRGRRVRVLHQGLLEPGRHEFAWDGRDDHGGGLASGTYLARALAADGGGDTQRVQLVK